MLQLFDLAFDYQDLPLLRNISFTLKTGDLLHLQGANGAGKTTLLKVLAGLYQPSCGEINFKGNSIQQSLQHYQQNICFVGHKTGISPFLTVKENCLYDLNYSGQSNLPTLLELFKLNKLMNSPCGILSSGQKRKVGLVRLGLTDALIWLLDEPLVALDDETLTILMAMIATHREQGGIVILTSHQKLPLAMGSYKEYLL